MKQKEMVLDYIKQFGSISTYEAFVDLGITRLAARIWDIKEDGQEFDVKRQLPALGGGDGRANAGVAARANAQRDDLDGAAVEAGLL